MGKEIYLKIDTCNGVITIPFKTIEDADKFTVIYSNMGELVNSLIKILGLKIDLYDVSAVYLTNDKYKTELDDKCFPIKYSRDNFNYRSLFDAFVTYIKNDPDRILTTNMRYVKSKEILDFYDSRMIDAYQIEKAVRAYFNGTGYKRKRDTYFMIKDDDSIRIKIDKVNLDSGIDRRNLSQYYSGNDDYFSHLIELAQTKPEMYEKVIDEIAQSDIEEMTSLLKCDGYGIVDGTSDSLVSIKCKISLLEETTGLSVDELQKNHTGFGRKRKHR